MTFRCSTRVLCWRASRQPRCRRAELPLAGRFVAFAPPQTAAPARAVAQAAAPAPRGAHAAQSAQIAQAVPLPRIAPVRVATVRDRPRDTTADKPTLFERLFGRSQPSPVTLAYADADTGSLGIGQNSATALEPLDRGLRHCRACRLHAGRHPARAHSGLGSVRDDPHHADVRDRGVHAAGRLRSSGTQKRRSTCKARCWLILEDESKVAKPLRAAGAQLHARPERRFKRLRVVPQLRHFPAGLSEPQDHAACRGVASGLMRARTDASPARVSCYWQTPCERAEFRAADAVSQSGSP